MRIKKRFNSAQSLSYRLFLSVAVLVTSLVGALAQQTIVVDPGGAGNYLTIAEALNSLNGTTITQQVTISVRPGYYTGHLVLDSVMGTSAQNQIIIESSTGDTADVVIQHDTVAIFPARAAMHLSNVSHVVIRNMTFRSPPIEGYSIGLDMGIGDITIEGNHFVYGGSGYDNPAISEVYNLDAFQNDSLGAVIIRNNRADNLFLFAREISFFKLAYLEISNNQVYFDINSTDMPIIQAQEVVVKNNVFHKTALGLFANSGSVEVSSNYCWSTHACIYFSTNIYAGEPSIIANNMLIFTSSAGIQVSGGDLRIWNNTLYAVDPLKQSWGIYLQDGDSTHIVNNIIAGLGSQTTGILFQDSIFPSSFRCDYNNYYLPNGIYSSVFTGSSYIHSNSIDDHNSFLKIDSNSYDFNPLFVSDTNVHIRNTLLTGKGLHITSITKDIDGDTRDSDEPTIGADVISGSIDLQPSSFIAFIGSFYPGKSMEVEYSVKNIGDLDLSSIPWTDRLYLSADQTIDEQDVLLSEQTNNFGLDAQNSYTRKPSVAIPYLSGGTYYFIVDVNSGRSAFEDTSNNVLVSSAKVLPNAQLPNLKVESINVPPSVYSGKSFTVDWTVKNVGTEVTSGSWTDRIYFATDSAYLNDPSTNVRDSLELIEMQAPKGLKVGESYTSSFSFSTPIKFSGNVYCRAQTNANQNIFEQDTSFTDNGKNSTSLNVVQSPLPDLTITDLNVPITAFSGDTVSVNWTVKNVGQQKTYRTDRFYKATPLQDNPVMWSDRLVISKERYYEPDSKENITKAYYTRAANDELGVDSSYRVERDVHFNRCEYGTYYVFVETNYRYSTFELLFDNNVVLIDSIELVLQPNPDLKPTALSLNNSAASGKELSIDYSVLNDGFDDIEGVYYSDRFFLHPNSQFIPEQLIPLGKSFGADSLLKTESYNETVSFQIPYDVYGNYYLSVATDYNNQLCEAPNEDNNIYTIGQFNIALSPQPDITVSIAELPDTVVAGENVTVVVETKNRGQAAVDESYFRNHVLLHGSVNASLKKYLVPQGLAASASRFDTLVLNIPLSAEEGIYQFRIVADYTENIYEHNAEANNTYLSDAFTIVRDDGRVPDLELVSLEVLESNVKAGDVITVEITLRNNGSSTTATGWKDRISLYDANDQWIDNEDENHLGRLIQGQTVVRTASFQLPYNYNGDLKLEYIVNKHNKPFEYKRDNNAEIIEIEVDAYIPPDLEPTAITTPLCCKVYALQSDTIAVTVSNNGPGAVAGFNYFSKLYLSDDPFIDKYDYVLATHQQFGGIISGSSETLSIPVKYPSSRSGDLYLLVDVDIENHIYEGANEDNNRLASGYTIHLSNEITDLSLDSVTARSYTGPKDPYVYLDYVFSKPMADTLDRSWTNRIVLSKTKELNESTILAVEERHTAALPSGTASFSNTLLATIYSDIEPGYYFMGLVLDSYNEIYESDLENNVLFTQDSFLFDFSTPLTLDVLKDTFWYEGRFATRAYYNVDRPADKGMIVQLDASLNNASTEMYHRIGKIPSNLYYDNKYDNPYLADQEIIVKVTDTAVKDYLYVKPAYVPPVYHPSDPNNDNIDVVPYTILAQSAEFSIYSVYPDNGSVWGITTVEVTGFDFDSTTHFYLTQGTDTIFPHDVGIINSSQVVLSLDLRDHELGKYNIRAVKELASANYSQAFEILDDGLEDPWVSLDMPVDELTRKYTQMTVNYGNYANSDGFDYWLMVAVSNTSRDLENLHTTYVGSSEEHLNEEFGFDGNPTGDSTYVDIDGIRYFFYWLPKLAAKSQATQTYLVNHSTLDTTVAIAYLFRQPMSVYTLTGRKEDLWQSTTIYNLYSALRNVDDLQYKQSLDCDQVNVENVQKEIAKQTIALAQNVHGGVATFSKANSANKLAAKAYEDFKERVLVPTDAQKVSEIVVKDMLIKEKSLGTVVVEWAEGVFENPLKGIQEDLYKEDPPFGDLIKDVFKCLDHNPEFREERARCLVCPLVNEKGHQFRRCRNICVPKKSKPKNLVDKFTDWIKARDPNEIIGPDGTTDLRFVNRGSTMPYTVLFENKSDAGAPAVTVQLNNPLDTAFRLQSFKLTELGFGDTVFYFNGENNLNRIIELGPKYNDQKLRVIAGLDLVNNRAIWRLVTIDPYTGNPVNDPYGGFLPPNDSTGIGEGYVKYEIDLRPEIESGYVVSNQADIIFDQNEIIPTNVWTNIVVGNNPFSVVNDLPAISPPEFTVSWTGNDGALGPGIHSYSVYVQKDSGVYQKWIAYSTDTSATFIGEAGSEYKFYSIVHLLNGTSEESPLSFDANTRIRSASIDEVIAQNQIVLYPNPGRTKLKLRQEYAKPLNVRMLTMEGRTIAEYHFTGLENSIDVSTLSVGVYVIEILDGNERKTFRWIKL